MREAAERQVGAAVRQDAPRMTPEQRANLAAGEQAGQPIVLGDLGGQTTRTLARTSANKSDEARAALTEVTGERFANQGQRASTWWDQITDAPRALQIRERLQDAAQMANRPAYRRAYTAGEGGIWDDVLQGLTTSPALRSAIREAEATGADRAAVQGFNAPRNPFVEAPDGTLTLRPGMTPTLQFWDHVQRNLRSVSDTAARAGDRETADRVGQLRRSLNNHLDAAVPEFGQARRGAAAWFGADDALEAGQNFLAQPLRGGHGEARQALARMNEAERGLFQQGVVESVRNRMHALSDNQDMPEPVQHARDAGPARPGARAAARGTARTLPRGRAHHVPAAPSGKRQLVDGSAIDGGGRRRRLWRTVRSATIRSSALSTAALARWRRCARARQHPPRPARGDPDWRAALASNDPEQWQRVVRLSERSPVVKRALDDLKNFRAARGRAAGRDGNASRSPA